MSFPRKLALFVCWLLLSSMVGAVELKTAAQDSPPKFIRNADGHAAGISVDVMHEITRLDPGIQFSGENQFLPFKRIEAMLASGELDVFFGFIKNPDREAHYVYIDPPIYMVSDILVARRDDPVDIRRLEDLVTLGKDGVVLITMGVQQGDQLRAMGVQVDDGGKSLVVNLQKLAGGRGRFAFQSEIEMRTALKASGDVQSRLRILPARFNTGGRYVAFSSKVPPEVVNRVRAALEKMAKSGTLDRIYARYM